jgi:hypothetical protein
MILHDDSKNRSFERFFYRLIFRLRERMSYFQIWLCAKRVYRFLFRDKNENTLTA